MLLFIFAVPT